MLALCSALFSLTPVSPPQDAAAARLEMQPVEIALPDGGHATAWRGMLRVPIVRADPASKEIGVDVWQFKAVEGAPPGRPPVFLLHGGPGWPGLQPSSIDWEGEVAPRIAHADLVIVGQRGIGTSEPNTSCAAFARPVDPDLPDDERAAALRAQCAECRTHWESQGYDLAGFNVIEAAADVDDVRQMLGYSKIALFGGSFGSHWAMAVMRFHPDSVARAVLHGMEGPDHTYDPPGGLLAVLERIATEAQASAELAGKLPDEGLVEALRTVIRAVDEDPFPYQVDGVEVPIDGDGLRELALGYTARVNSRDSVGGWPADVMRLYEGDFEAAARAILRGRRGTGFLPTASFFGLDCGSGITRERLERYRSDPAVEVVGDPTWFYEAACPAWGADLGDDFRTGFQSSIPTLIVHGTWDVSTPLENALELLPLFERAHFVPVEGGTHGALGEAVRHDPTFRAALDAFLVDGATDGLPEAVALPPIAWTASW
ncbi:MAG TPA: alpha/beta fold hydrolase [Planctomycetota bacterium]|nr:alpha/beta fold hydrolase [Planctomycetota bacterium]